MIPGTADSTAAARAPASATPAPHVSTWRRPVSWFARLALLAALASALTALLAGPGYRFGAWPLGVAFTILRWAAYGAVVATVLGVIGAAVTRRGSARRGFTSSVAAILIGGATFAVPAAMLVRAKQVPAIHDITTDTENPPVFAAILLARSLAPNSAAYGGPEVAAQQRRAYPEIAPLYAGASPETMFRRALAAASESGWIVVAAVPAEGRIEATDTTFFFGFKDDVVVRVRPSPGGSRVDVRSVSRVGESDIGTNARRIRSFLARLRDE